MNMVQMANEERSRKEQTLEALVEGKKLEAYVEHRTRDMHVCAICGSVGYKKRPMKCVGTRWFCMDCLRQLKEVLNTLEQWDAEVQMEKELSKKIDDGLGL
jgi:ribosomal protein L37AE/L43A